MVVFFLVHSIVLRTALALILAVNTLIGDALIKNPTLYSVAKAWSRTPAAGRFLTISCAVLAFTVRQK